MNKPKPFTFQLFVMAGFLFFFYMFYALAKSIYYSYNVEKDISKFQEEVDLLSQLVEQRPRELEYYYSDQYQDLHGKEAQNLLNLGEVSIVISQPDQRVEQGPVDLMTDELSPDSILNQPNNVQWWAYFFGDTLTVDAPLIEENSDESLEEREA